MSLWSVRRLFRSIRLCFPLVRAASRQSPRSCFTVVASAKLFLAHRSGAFSRAIFVSEPSRLKLAFITLVGTSPHVSSSPLSCFRSSPRNCFWVSLSFGVLFSARRLGAAPARIAVGVSHWSKIFLSLSTTSWSCFLFVGAVSCLLDVLQLSDVNRREPFLCRTTVPSQSVSVSLSCRKLLTESSSQRERWEEHKETKRQTKQKGIWSVKEIRLTSVD